ncbi:unnamed protein product [Strongylus vulgaris]|uniref:Uncharacterized protein n=1 Tax=Strongylus vulgaris TaxID=40348 RepID=A0A3P7J0D9_STRVU|nr:unnamed protein product [Strongylus vulgaris]
MASTSSGPVVMTLKAADDVQDGSDEFMNTGNLIRKLYPKEKQCRAVCYPLEASKALDYHARTYAEETLCGRIGLQHPAFTLFIFRIIRAISHFHGSD